MSIGKVGPPESDLWQITATSALTYYRVTGPFPAGAYGISCVTSRVAEARFVSGTGTQVAYSKTVNGSASVSVTQEALFCLVVVDTGTNTAVNIERIGDIATITTATLDTIASSGNYTLSPNSTATLCCAIGGGSGGRSAVTYSAGVGGWSGAAAIGSLTPGTTYAITIGAGGAAGAPPGAGGTTNVGNVLSAAGGTQNSGGSAGGNAIGGFSVSGFGGTGASGGTPGSGVNIAGFPTGSGGAGGTSSAGAVGGGIYAGGGGGSYAVGPAYSASAATGYGGGGGGGSHDTGGGTGSGSVGAAGVVYVLRWS